MLCKGIYVLCVWENVAGGVLRDVTISRITHYLFPRSTLLCEAKVRHEMFFTIYIYLLKQSEKHKNLH